ncbi:MAG: hypothetical protein MUC51_03010 [Anaerolineae bacterium]|nr:hypothetical protein [Anaerolineae bacterium]
MLRCTKFLTDMEPAREDEASLTGKPYRPAIEPPYRSDRDRVDVILTNPPFGGEEEAGIKAGFPADKQTAETALLFLQLIMRKLRRPDLSSPVVGKGAGRRAGLAAPRSSSQTARSLVTVCVLASRRSLPTAWWGSKACREWRTRTHGGWISARSVNDAVARATPHWQAAERANAEASRLETEVNQVDAALRQALADLPLLATANAKEARRKLEERRAALLAGATRQRQAARDEQATGDGIYWPILNLDLKNPTATETLAHVAPEQLVTDILAAEQRIIELMEEIRDELSASA